MINPPAVVHDFPRLVLKRATTVLMDGLLPGTPAAEVPLIYCMDERHDEPCPLPCPACEDEC